MQQHWKNRAMLHAEAITDAWEVTKSYAARLAEWVLFVCMILNIIEILPDVGLPVSVSNAVLAVQSVTLDIAGFGLTSMADHAKALGDEAAARKGHRTGWLLIGLMITTLLLVSAGLLWPILKQYTDPAEKVLILARVVMTVVYGHVVHSLRHSTQAATPVMQQPTPVLDYGEIAQHLQAIMPQPQAQEIDLYALAQQVVALLPKPADEEAMIERLKPVISATVQVALEPLQHHQKSGAEATGNMAMEPPRLLALEPPKHGAGASRRSHPKSGSGAARIVDSEPPVAVRLQRAYEQLIRDGERVSGRALAAAARCNRGIATDWLQSQSSEPFSEALG